MSDWIFIILAPLFLAGAIVAVYMTFRQQRLWKAIEGAEIKVSAIFLLGGLAVLNRNNANAAVRLLNNKIILKLFPISPAAALAGKFVTIKTEWITKVLRKKNGIMGINAIGPLLEIYMSGTSNYYQIYADDATLDKMITYLNSHNIQTSQS